MKKLYTVILIFIFIIGLSLMLYPTISFRWNELHQSRAIAKYVEDLKDLDEEDYLKIWNSAVEYNNELLEKGENVIELTEELKDKYHQNLNAAGNGIMGYIEIPSISCSLPIYHTTQEEVLQIAVGHMEGSSLPVGGEGTHCVLSGHRGLPSARLFTDLDKIDVGDVFTINVLKETLTYQVYEILTVLPHEIDNLKAEEGKDLCTLVTCTPYGVNSHRLLVKAHRIDDTEEKVEVRVVSEAMQIEPIIVASVIAVPVLLLLLIILLIQPKKIRK